MRRIKSLIKIIFIIQIFFCRASFAAQMAVYYINVGQGDSEYIEFPNGENLLIDGGPNSSTLQTNPLIAFLDSKGVSTIKHVILSHAHADHYGGLIAVFDKYTVERYYDSFLWPAAGADTFRTNAKSRVTIKYYDTVNEIPNGTTFYAISAATSSPALSITMLHKGDAFASIGTSANDFSLVFKIVYGSSTFIFGGDAAGDTGSSGSYQPIERWLIDNYSASTLKADCYKVHHHSSSTSSSTAFLSILRPQYAFVELGPNTYGFPKADTISRLTGAGVQKIYYTGYNPSAAIDGTIQVVTTGDGTYQITPNYVPGATLPKPTVTISASPASISSGQTFTLSWTSVNASSVTITPDIGTVGPDDFRQITPAASITYAAIAAGPGGASEPAYASVTVDNKPPPPPPAKPTVTISATPDSITSGQTTTISWTSTDASSVTITPNIGIMGASGSRPITPAASITYTAIASGPGGTSLPAYISITVNNLPPPPAEPTHNSYIVLFNNLFNPNRQIEPDEQQWTQFQYYISKAGEMDVKVYTLDGELVREEKRYDANPGTYLWAWYGKNRNEETAAAGVYILKIKTADMETTKKAILIR